MRCALGLLAVALITGGWVFAEEPKGNGPPASTTMRVPDRTRFLVTGDRAEIYDGDAPGCKMIRDYYRLMKAIVAKDDVGIRQVYDDQRADLISNGTQVLILKSYRRELIAEDYNHIYDDPAEVRIIDGPFKDEIRFVPEKLVAKMRFIQKPLDPKVVAKPIDPEIRAAAILRMAESLEKAKKPAGALTLYRQIAKDYPRTAAATKASTRIKTLTVKP